MCWNDTIITENTLKLRDEFGVKLYVETGSWAGINVEFMAHHFERAMSCDVAEGIVKDAQRRVSYLSNASVELERSSNFLKQFSKDEPIIFFLDAHFYQKGGGSIALADELASIGSNRKCIIIIHDYDNGSLGYSSEGNVKVNWDLVGSGLLSVNPNFHLYTNSKDLCGVIDYNDLPELPITVDGNLLLAMKDVTSENEFARYRGVLYAVPRKLDLSKYKMVEYVIPE